MKRKFFVLIAFVMFAASICAQTDLRTKKYKGFVNADLSMVSINNHYADGGSGSGFGMNIKVVTSHGVQVCPYFFAGAGLGVSVGWGDEEAVMDMDLVQVPLFLQVRGNLTSKPVSPYVDFKGGYSAGDMNGAFLSPALGLSVPVCNKLALNVELAYQVQNNKEDYTWGTERTWRHFLSFGLGIEF